MISQIMSNDKKHILYIYIHYIYNRRKFRSQTSDNMDEEMERVREKRRVEERRVEERRSEKRKSQKRKKMQVR